MPLVVRVPAYLGVSQVLSADVSRLDNMNKMDNRYGHNERPGMSFQQRLNAVLSDPPVPVPAPVPPPAPVLPVLSPAVSPGPAPAPAPASPATALAPAPAMTPKKLTMSQFRQQMTEKSTGKVKKVPSARPSKNIVAKFDEPYDFDQIKPAIHEFYPDNNGESAGSLARYVGRRRSSTGKKIEFAVDARRDQTTWPFSTQLAGGVCRA